MKTYIEKLICDDCKIEVTDVKEVNGELTYICPCGNEVMTSNITYPREVVIHEYTYDVEMRDGNTMSGLIELEAKSMKEAMMKAKEEANFNFKKCKSISIQEVNYVR